MDPIQQLEREWQMITPRLTQHLRHWQRAEPALAPFSNPQLLVRFLQNPDADPRLKDGILAALLRQAQTDSEAGRVVLQALLPGLKRLAANVILDQRDRGELQHLLLSSAWERIRGYPLARRPARIAANLLRDTRRGALNAFAREHQGCYELPERPLERVPAERSDVDLERPLRRAVAANALTAEEAELILRTRIDGADLHALAREAGLPYNTLVVRRLRAERRLLLFLGQRPVTSGGRKAHSSYARAVGDGLTGSAGRGAVTHLNRRR
jgi:DNA-directed RNA polymerase specialized sigma24 family protein